MKIKLPKRHVDPLLEVVGRIVIQSAKAAITETVRAMESDSDEGRRITRDEAKLIATRTADAAYRALFAELSNVEILPLPKSRPKVKKEK